MSQEKENLTAERSLQQLQDSLRESDARYSRLLASITDYIYSVRVENSISVETIHGPGCVAVTGYTAEAYRADPNLWYRMVYPEDRMKVVAMAECAQKGLMVDPIQHRIYHRDGTVRWLSNTVVVKKDSAGQVVSYDGLVSDITARERADQALRDSAKQWEMTFDAIGDLIFIQDKDLNIVRVNKACVDVLKMDPKDIVGKKCFEVMHHMEHPRLGCPFEKVKLDGQVHTEEVNDPRLGISLLATVSPIFNVDGQFIGAVHIARDVTQIKKAEEQRQEHLHELEIFYKGSMGREERILELKEEVSLLKARLERKHT